MPTITSLATLAGNTGDAEGDVFTNIENLAGSGFLDTLIGNDNNNELRGLGGEDTLIGGPGGDQFDGGANADFASYADSFAAVNVSLARPRFNTGDAEGDTYVKVEGVIGSFFGDRLTGNDVRNTLFGAQGDDTVTGGKGKDILWGDLDTFGTDGADTFLFTSPQGGTDTVKDFDVFDHIAIDRSGFHLGPNYRFNSVTFVSNDSPSPGSSRPTFTTVTPRDCFSMLTATAQTRRSSSPGSISIARSSLLEATCSLWRKSADPNKFNLKGPAASRAFSLLDSAAPYS